MSQEDERYRWIYSTYSKDNDFSYSAKPKEKPISENVKSKYINKEFVPEKDNQGNWHCGECVVRIQSWDISKVIITNIRNNTNSKTKAKYPYYAQFKIIND